MASFSFDTNTVEKRENNFELLPAGWYAAQVIDSDIAPLKSGKGQCIKLTFEVLSEGYRGRKIWTQLNVRHENPDTERWAQQSLRELCDAVGVVHMGDTVELHNRPVQIRVKVRVSKDPQYEDQNDIANFKTVGGAAAPSMLTPARVAAPAAPAANAAAQVGSVPPWQKKNAA